MEGQLNSEEGTSINMALFVTYIIPMLGRRRY